MRVLFVPVLGGLLGHVIPLLALDRSLRGTGVETAFLLPRYIHEFARKLGVRVLDYDYTYEDWVFNSKTLRNELAAYGEFKPDVVLDDNNFTTGVASSLTGLPRVTVLRPLPDPGEKLNGRKYLINLAVPDIKMWPDVTFLGLKQPEFVTDLFKAEVTIIPGMKSVEAIPPRLEHGALIHFSGALLLDDESSSHLLSSIEGTDPSDYANVESLEKFFDANRGRKFAFMTLGTVASPDASTYECLRYLLDSGVAVMTTIKIERLTPEQRDRYYFARWFPMHYVCSRIDLAVHHCGCGTYHYPLIHKVPTVTIGTGWADRDDVALRLQALGASAHIPHSEKAEQFRTSFEQGVAGFLNDSSVTLERAKASLETLNQELNETASRFRLEQVLEDALRAPRNKL